MIRQKKIAWLNMEDIWFETDRFTDCKALVVALHSNDVLDKQCYDFKLDSYTFLVDISKDIDDIFKTFDYKSLRYRINKGKKDKIQVIKAETSEELQRFYEFQISFCKSKQIPTMKIEELELMDCYYALSAENEYLGGCAFITSADKTTVRYKYGATKHKLNANEMILWNAICDYHD